MPTPTLAALVYAIRWEAKDIVSVELRPARPDVTFPPFEAGAHINLNLPNGLSRSYSLCNADSDRQRYVVAVARDRKSRGGSVFVHEQLRVGTVLEIDPPRNNFKLQNDQQRTVLLAGGIGITPLLSMLRHLSAAKNRDVDFIYCARKPGEAAFVDELKSIADQSGINLTLRFDCDYDTPPYLPEMLANLGEKSSYYCCGPAPMLNAFEEACQQLGYANANIERFVAEEKKIESTGEFDVVCARSKKTVHVPAGKTILDALIDAGLDPDYSCTEGICGTCEQRVLECDGELEHNDSVLTKSERASGKTIMICVSRCTGSRLVLDI